MWIWFGLAALALIGEVMSGTFYLLLVAVGLFGGGLAVALDLGIQWQLVVCGLVVLAGLLVMRLTGVLKKREVNASSNKDVNLDIGQTVRVEAWSENRTARVWYRGAHWNADLAPDEAPVPGVFHIIEINGSRLLLRAHKENH